LKTVYIDIINITKTHAVTRDIDAAKAFDLVVNGIALLALMIWVYPSHSQRRSPSFGVDNGAMSKQLKVFQQNPIDQHIQICYLELLRHKRMGEGFNDDTGIGTTNPQSTAITPVIHNKITN
jgi:hypothetical protein